MDRKSYAALLERSVVLPRRLADENAPKKTLSTALMILLARSRAGDARALRGVLRAGMLPARFMHQVAVQLPEMAELAGIESQTPIGALRFARKAFFAAAQVAFETGAAVVEDTDGVAHRIVGARASNDNPATVTIELDGGEHCERDARLGLVDPNSALERVVERCEVPDTGPAERARLLALLNAVDDPIGRVPILDEHLRDGPLAFYILLRQSLTLREAVTADAFMPPSVGRLTGWLRLDPADAADLDSAASLVLGETDLFTALDRNVALPRSLPQVLLDAFLDLDPRQRRVLVKRLWPGALHGVAAAHLVVLAWHALEGARHRCRVANAMARRLAQVCAETGHLHLRLVRWLTNEFSRSQVARAWSPTVLLAIAWSHANELFRLLTQSGVPNERIGNLGDEMYPYEERLFGPPQVRDDSSHPGNVQVETYTLGCADLVIRAGVDVEDKARATLLSLLLTFSEDERPTGFSASLLNRNEQRSDALRGIFARSWDDQTDAVFRDVLRLPLRVWREDMAVSTDLVWLRLSARHGDCLINDAEDRLIVENAAAALPLCPIDWSSMDDRHRFCMVMHNVASYPYDLAQSVRDAWSRESGRASSINEKSTRAAALDTLLLTAVDLAADVDQEKAVGEFASLCSLLRRTFNGDTDKLDNLVKVMHPRLRSDAARHLDKLVVAGRTK